MRDYGIILKLSIVFACEISSTNFNNGIAASGEKKKIYEILNIILERQSLSKLNRNRRENTIIITNLVLGI